MINNNRFKLAVESKIGWLTKYYAQLLNIEHSDAYIYIIKSGVIDILKDKDSRLYLEDVALLKDAIDIYYKHGSKQMKEFLYKNIG